LNKFSKAALDTATEMSCPDCSSNLFFQTIEIKKISALMTGTGQPGAVSKLGPLLCVKCHRQLKDEDFGYGITEEVSQKSKEDDIVPEEDQDEEEARYCG
jgi:DNA-directed RNA polymerase subunit RPC12/RpoP